MLRTFFFHGEYKAEDRYSFVENTDLIHNVYFTPNMMIAMANKYYDGAIFYRPLLCMEGSYMGRRAAERGTGLECNPYSADFSQRIYEYYTTLAWDNFTQKCDMEVEQVIEEYRKGVDVIRQIFVSDR